MKSSIRGAILGSAGVALLGLAGCENNEASIKNDGVTPPGAAATSEEGAKVKVAPRTKPPEGYNTGYGRSKSQKQGPVAPNAPAKTTDAPEGKK
jgi:hypothetical protein